MARDSTAPEQLLRGASLRVTPPRVAVLLEIEHRPHSDVDTLTRAVRTRLGSVSTQAVYDVLRALTSAGLLRRFEPAGSPARYELDAGDNHHHLVCRRCGRIEDVPCATGRAPCLHPRASHGFTVDEAEVLYWGLCRGCQPVPGEPSSTTHRAQQGSPSEQFAPPAKETP